MLRGCIEERRVKYLDSWASTFAGIIRVNPPLTVPLGWKYWNFKKVKAFEFFLWSDIVPQPTFDYIKRRLADAVGVKASDFKFVTESGGRIDYKSIVLDECARLCACGVCWEPFAKAKDLLS